MIRDRSETSRTSRLAILLAGIITSQVILYGPSLVGAKILLPLDLLAQPDVWIPVRPEATIDKPHDQIHSDIVYMFEPERMFVASELRAGRWPLWMPGQFAGKPVLHWPWLSPLPILLAAVRSPVVLAWHQLLAAVIAGVGFYLFCRRALGIRFWPAAITAWSYPMTGFFVLWLGFSTCAPVYWLPWLVLAVDTVVRRPGWRSMAALSLATCATLCNRQLDVVAQVLIVAGLYGLWRIYDIYGRDCLRRPARRAGVLVLSGWLLGFSLAAPYVMSVVGYTVTGARGAERAAGFEERVPNGLSALPLLVLPDVNGSTRRGSYPLPGPFQIESMSAAYAGLIATLFLAPLAWRSRRHRSFAVFASALTVLGLGWCLNIGGIVMILRLPGLNLMSHNRLVFAASFAILAMAAVGLDSLAEPVDRRHRRRAYVVAGLLAVLALWWFYRVGHLPELVETGIGKSFVEGQAARWIADAAGVGRVQSWFAHVYLAGALLALAAGAMWLLLARLGTWRSGASALVGAIMFMDMLWFAHGRSGQHDPALYYPRVPLLDKIAEISRGRVIAFQCLPANLALVAGLRDVRGYDGVDPARYLELLRLAADPENEFVYARIEWLKPKVSYPTLETVKLSPVLDLLGVEYYIIRGAVQGSFRPPLVAPDYWALRNPAAMSRAFVPRLVESIADEQARLAKLGAPDFDPRAVAYVETPIDLPEEARGRASIVAETPTAVTLALAMETPGLVVLTDRWDEGWRARLDGHDVPILRTDHALRGVVVPQGPGTLEFSYEPSSFSRGLLLSALAVLVLGGLWVVEIRRQRRARRA